MKNPFAAKKEKEEVIIPSKTEMIQRISNSNLDAETLFYLLEFAQRFPSGMISFETGLSTAKKNVDSKIKVIRK